MAAPPAERPHKHDTMPVGVAASLPVESVATPVAGNGNGAAFGHVHAPLGRQASISTLHDAAVDAVDRQLQQIQEARIKGYEGEACLECANFTLVRSGTCLKCDTCGSTSGCS